MSLISLAEDFKIVVGSTPITTNAAVTGDYVCLKNVHRAFVVFNLNQAVGHATTCSLMRATAVAPTGATAVTESVEIWMNEDVATSDTLVKQTAAASIAVTNDIKNKLVVMMIDPAVLAATFDCIAGKTTASSQATNHVSIMYYLQMRYHQATPPTAITD